MYLDPAIVKKAFSRLQFTEYEGKSPKERTSGLMYMLSIDAIMREQDRNSLDMSGSYQGLQNKKKVMMAYSQLVTITPDNRNTLRHVAELGRIEYGGKTPESKIRSNFFSRQIDAGEEASGVSEYPRRPAPLMLIGPDSASKCTVRLHPLIKTSLAQYLSCLRTNTPYTDLAIFCLRTEPIEEGTDLTTSLCHKLETCHTSELAQLWTQKITSERKFSPYEGMLFLAPRFVDALASYAKPSRAEELATKKKEELIEIILKLEAEIGGEQ